MSLHASEVASGRRFEFGRNWRKFLERFDERRIVAAENSLRTMLGVVDLEGLSFADIGSGSGLFSLAARRLGANVMSIDFDPNAVECTELLRQCYYADDDAWIVRSGSILDRGFIADLGEFDVVYSWGVLHHTGDMISALSNVESLVAQNGSLFIAIYNDQGRPSRYWLSIKRAYNGLSPSFRWLVVIPCAIRLWGPTMIRDLLGLRPLYTWRTYGEGSARGMDPWRDLIDWVGGLPFEVAKPEEIFDFFRARGFTLEVLRTCAGGHGCNEFVFRRYTAASR